MHGGGVMTEEKVSRTPRTNHLFWGEETHRRFHVKHFGEMLDLLSAAGEDEGLEPCHLEETIMRGRRRGRNRSSPQDSPVDSGTDTGGDGAVTLIEPTPPAPTESRDAATPVSSMAVDQAPSAPPTVPLRSTMSDVAFAHAELDDVLPPTDAGGSGAEHPAADELPDPPPVVETARVVSPEETVPEEVPEHTAATPVVVDATSSTELIGAEVTSAPAALEREPQAASGTPLPRVLAVANQKGGVGKTTTSVNLGAALAEIGFRVLVIDLDPQGNATTGLGIDARNFELSMYDVMMRDASLEDCVEPTSMKNLFVAPATIALAGAEIELVPAFSRELKLKRAIESVIEDFDYVLIDCPPSLGLITVNALAAAGEVLVPIQCEYYALEGLSQLMRNVHLVASNLNPKLDISTIVLTMYDARTKLSDQVANEVRQHFGTRVCRIVIPRTVRLSEAPSFGQPITAFDPASRGAIAYRELAKEVSGGTS
jgi:chromosome partitioning protein